MFITLCQYICIVADENVECHAKFLQIIALLACSGTGFALENYITDRRSGKRLSQGNQPFSSPRTEEEPPPQSPFPSAALQKASQEKGDSGGGGKGEGWWP